MITRNRKILFAIAAALGFKPHKGQVKVLEAFSDGVRFLCIVCGRRWGKTRVASILTMFVLMQKDAKILCMSKTYKLAYKMWKYVVKDVRAMFQPHEYRIIQNPPTIIMAWGATLELGSADNPDSLLGDGYDVVIDDEGATMKEKIWEQNIGPMVRDRKGTVVIITTPRGHTWVYRKFQLGQLGQAGWWSYRGIYTENTAVYDAEEIALVKEQTDKLYYLQEYMAEFVSFVDQVYPDFSEERHVIQELPEDFDSWEKYLTIDPGYAQMCAMVWKGYNTVTGEIIIYDEVLKPRMRYEDIIREIKEREPGGGYAGFICDVAGNQREQTGRSFINTLMENEWFVKKGYYIFSKKYGIISGINKVRARLLNVDGKVRLRVLAKCVGVIEMFQNFHYPEDAHNDLPDKDGVWDHPADVIRYFVEYICLQERGNRSYDL